MKFRDKMTGATYEPSDEVAALMADNPNLEKVEEEKPKAAPKKEKPKKE